MAVDLILEEPRWEPVCAAIELAVAAALDHLGVSGDVALLGCDDARIAALNADFRGRPQPTNVLSWPSEERAALEPGARPQAPVATELGDIAIAYETCEREALAQAKPFEAHVSHLVVHGVLHLLGYDHENEPDAALMEGLEVEILGNLGVPDPYSPN